MPKCGERFKLGKSTRLVAAELRLRTDTWELQHGTTLLLDATAIYPIRIVKIVSKSPD